MLGLLERIGVGTLEVREAVRGGIADLGRDQDGSWSRYALITEELRECVPEPGSFGSVGKRTVAQTSQ